MNLFLFYMLTEAGELSTECDLNKDFLIDLKDLKIFVDKDYVDDHRRFIIIFKFLLVINLYFFFSFERAVLNSINTKSLQLYKLVEPSFKVCFEFASKCFLLFY